MAGEWLDGNLKLRLGTCKPGALSNTPPCSHLPEPPFEQVSQL